MAMTRRQAIQSGAAFGAALAWPAGVRFAFVSCQNVTQGASNAYRRMIWEGERAAEADRLGFVLHLGDFVYERVRGRPE